MNHEARARELKQLIKDQEELINQLHGGLMVAADMLSDFTSADPHHFPGQTCPNCLHTREREHGLYCRWRKLRTVEPIIEAAKKLHTLRPMMVTV